MQLASDGTIKISTELDNAQAQSAMQKFGKLVKTGVAALAIKELVSDVAQIGGYVIKTGMEFESSFAGVKKTVNATDEELQVMRDDIRDMAKNIPQTASAISEVAEAAGQLGIKNDYIMDFTRTMSDLGVATNMSATEAATSLARLANITQMPQTQFSNLGSTVVALGNNLATTESEITAMGLRLAGAGKQVGMSEAQILGLAGALSSVGIEADAGGSAMSTVMSKIQLAVEQGGESLAQFADVAGMSSEQFKEAFQNDAAQAIVSFVTGLGTMESRGKSAIGTLADMEITEIRQRDALLRLSGAGDVLSDSLSIATQAWDENNALTNEAEQRYETLESRLQILKNNVGDFGISIYDGLRDPLKNTVNESITYVERLHSAFTSGGLKSVVQELGEVFDEVTDEIAGTSDAAAGVVTPLKNIATVAGGLVKTVLPVAADGALLLAENFDILLPVITASTAGFKAFNVIGKVTTTTTKANAAAVAALNVMEKKNALQLVASNGGLTVRQTLLALYNGQITVATALTGLWAKAQNVLNAAFAANPIGVVVAGVAAFSAGMIALVTILDKAIGQDYRLSDSQKKVLRSLEDTTEALNEQKTAREESVQSIDREYDSYESLLSELQSITDENGKVKAGYEERAKVITGLLSDALGTEITMMDGVIDKYDETINAIKELIVQKKAEALAASMQDDMAQAYEKSEQAIEDYKNAQAALEEQQKKVTEAEEAYRKGGPKQKAVLDQAIADQEKLETALQDAKTAMQELSTEVNNYDALMNAMASGDIAQIEEAMNALVTAYQSYTTEALAASEETRQEMYDQANSYVENMKLVQDGTVQVADSVYQDMARAAINSINEFNKLPGGVAQGIQDIGPEASAAMISALAQADLDGKLDAEAQGDVKSFIDGFSNLDEETKEAWSQAWYGALEGLEGFENLADPAKEGADAFLESLRAALEVHSPSAAAARIFEQVWPGACQGLENGQEELSAKGNGVIQNFLATLSEGGLIEGAQSIGQRIMQFFGLGVSSQQENSRAAGKANADAAGAGAGSVDPSGIGALFGSLFSGGIGGMIGTLFTSGKGLSDSAKSGAGSVNPSSAGGQFGTQYASGIGEKAIEASAKGKSLAISADSGARSKSGYDAGSSFGSGFISGIGSWISSAASKAAELANSALSAAKRALDSHSPSKKGRKLGRTLPQGLGLGIEDDAEKAVKAAESMSEDTLDAVNMDSLSEMLRGIDIPDVMSRIYAAVDDKQSQVADRVTAAVSAKENIIWKEKQADQKIYLSDEDIEKLAKKFAAAASEEMAKELDGLKMYYNKRELSRVIREVSN